MESDQIRATIILTLESVELYETTNQTTSLMLTGPLSILYLATYNSFVIKIKSFNYSLSKEIPILASTGKGSDAFPSYVLPNCGGYYIIKIVKVASMEALSSFETILSNHSDLAYKEEDDEEVEETPGNERLIELKKERPEGEEKEKSANTKKTKVEMTSNIIYKGGELTKAGMIKSAEVVSKGISKLGEFVKRKYIKKTVDKDLNESTVNKFKLANTTTGAALTFTQAQVTAIFTVGTEIAKEVGRKIQKTETGQKIGNYKYTGTVVEIGKSTIHAAASIYDGMTEALFIVARGVGNTTTKIVAHKYGENAGAATQAGLDAVGNIGKLTKAYKVGAAQALEDATAKKK